MLPQVVYLRFNTEISSDIIPQAYRANEKLRKALLTHCYQSKVLRA